MQNCKNNIQKSVDSMKEELLELSHFIHSNPELGNQEFKACQYISSLLEKHGFSVQRRVAGLETSFIATAEGNGQGPHVAICCEYDALPEVDHGCGHNIIASSSVGAFLAVAKELKNFGGRLSIFGTPAEESTGGKLDFLAHGLFKDVDFAIMMHPTSGPSVVNRGGRNTCRIRVRFNGKAGHSAQPESAINALDAAVDFYNEMRKAKDTFQKGDNLNIIIKEGGTASNVIPATALLECNFRTTRYSRAEELIKTTDGIAKGIAEATGCKYELQIVKMSYERYPNYPLSTAFKANTEMLGETIEYADNSRFYGSSDMNNVSVHLPIIHDYLSICSQPIPTHSMEFAEAAISERGDEVCLLGAKTLGMTAIDIFSNPKLREEAYSYQKKAVPESYGTFGK